MASTAPSRSWMAPASASRATSSTTRPTRSRRRVTVTGTASRESTHAASSRRAVTPALGDALTHQWLTAPRSVCWALGDLTMLILEGKLLTFLRIYLQLVEKRLIHHCTVGTQYNQILGTSQLLFVIGLFTLRVTIGYGGLLQVIANERTSNVKHIVGSLA